MSEKKSDAGNSLDLSGEKIHWNQDMSYGEYLGLDTLLSAQNPATEQHDEMLFIIIHQATELWMKLSIHELQAAIKCVRNDELGPAFKMIARIARIQTQLIQSWDVLSTMTPFDYLKFRDDLGQSSGFQSYQYRMLEFALGNKCADLVKVHAARPAIHEKLTKVLNAPSLYDEALMLLQRRGFDVPYEVTNRDWSLPYVYSEKVEKVWLDIYRNAEEQWEVYELAEKLMDLEYRFQQWRFAHMKTVERIIGMKTGTGGSSGVSYLQKALSLRFFPELWSLRTKL